MIGPGGAAGGAGFRAEIARAAEIVARGGVVCFPTETTYGLAAFPTDRAALRRLSRLKGRAETAPFALIAPDVAAARAFARVWPERAEMLAAYWPAPLTLVIPAREDLPGEIVGPGGGVGVRVSPHPVSAELVRVLGAAVTATSANPSGQPAAVSADEARRYFQEGVDAYLDAGPATQVEPSTVVAISDSGEAQVLRKGAFGLPPELGSGP